MRLKKNFTKHLFSEHVLLSLTDDSLRLEDNFQLYLLTRQGHKLPQPQNVQVGDIVRLTHLRVSDCFFSRLDQYLLETFC